MRKVHKMSTFANASGGFSHSYSNPYQPVYAQNPWIGRVACEGEATNDPCSPRGLTPYRRGFGAGGAPWALGLAAGLVVLSAVSSSSLNGDQNSVTAVINATSALTFTTGAASTGEEAAALRAQVLALAGVVRQIAYDAALLDFSGRPAAAFAPNQITAITQPAVTATSTNSAVFLALGLLAIFAIVYWS